MQKKGKPVPLCDQQMGFRLPSQGLKPPKIPDAQVHFIISAFILQVPDLNVMGLAEV
jgi:hypothetical protein